MAPLQGCMHAKSCFVQGAGSSLALCLRLQHLVEFVKLLLCLAEHTPQKRDEQAREVFRVHQLCLVAWQGLELEAVLPHKQPVAAPQLATPRKRSARLVAHDLWLYAEGAATCW
eukprot:CAMPEP_0202862380 /NCGR_PEP_ID=MMETSP1391-20130828/3449_1 /ASSEMBLY_ACC=CAM_ASM_000867 /TAXON_ID=1034604 /ORGANISM="Chlamydomonas leiostraca, Strain SAG 11-49" /LENGTH=113 /DNA_ID=CAMNT_0049541915 /DNA_START=229 /DNA_END=567 /DNA_ORIENTATION=+